MQLVKKNSNKCVRITIYYRTLLKFGRRVKCKGNSQKLNITLLGDVEQSNLSQHLTILRKQNVITSTKVGLKVMCRIKYPEVLIILENVQVILARQFREGEALMRHLVKRKED